MGSRRAFGALQNYSRDKYIRDERTHRSLPMPGPTDDVLRHLPVTSVEFEIMLALADDDRHGYGIMLEVEERTGGSVKLRPGTLYRAVDRMLEAGFIAEVPNRPVATEDQRRRYYRLTHLGRRVAAAEAGRLEMIVRSARSKKLLQPGQA